MNSTEKPLADLAILGLAVMGQNLALNFRDRGYRVAVFNRTPEVTAQFVSGRAPVDDSMLGCQTLGDVVASLSRPRKLLLLVKSGDPVDSLIAELQPLLDPGDILVDLGNSHFGDSERRANHLRGHGLRFVGCGISGGEAGARQGPALMPGGDATAWPELEAMLTAVAAKAEDGEPCVTWIGPGGAGHFVKMVHNGIEYGDMQLICEGYDVMRRLGFEYADIAAQFDQWNRGVLSSYLVDITARILQHRDENGDPTVERVLDTAGQKGTGAWTGIEALRAGVPAPLVAEAVFARGLSSAKQIRERAANVLAGPGKTSNRTPADIVPALEQALFAGKIVSYAQGFALLDEASEQRAWNLDLGDIAGIWRAGCIIRSPFLDQIRSVKAEGHQGNLLLAPYFAQALAGTQTGWRHIVSLGAETGIPLPALSSALAYYDGFRSASLPANLLQAQRDAFGAHLYERVDRPRGQQFHTEWLIEE